MRSFGEVRSNTAFWVTGRTGTTKGVDRSVRNGGFGVFFSCPVLLLFFFLLFELLCKGYHFGAFRKEGPGRRFFQRAKKKERRPLEAGF